MTNKQQVLLKNGNIINIEDGSSYKGSILIDNGIITHILKANSGQTIFANVDCPEIDLEGKWLIPGLMDMHVHIKHGFAPHFVASGVTTVRNTGGNVIELKDLMEAPDDAPTPRVYSADRLIDGPPGLWGETSPWNLTTDNHGEARKEVQRQVEAGANLIKVYGWLSKELMEIVVDEAKKHNKEVSCDILYSSDIDAVDAAEMGIVWNEHVSGFIQAMFPPWEMKSDQALWDKINWEEPNMQAIEEVCKKVLKHQVKLCPTMVLYDQQSNLPAYWTVDNKVTSSIGKEHGLIKQWSSLLPYEESLQKLGMQHTIIKAIARKYSELGGVVVAGTDTPAGIFTYPGMALHRELELFVESGFSPLEALQAATIHAAKSIHRSDLGIIKEGAVADLVILDKSPLTDINNTQLIHKIVKGGRVYTQSEILDQVLSEEESMKIHMDFIGEFEKVES